MCPDINATAQKMRTLPVRVARNLYQMPNVSSVLLAGTSEIGMILVHHG